MNTWRRAAAVILSVVAAGCGGGVGTLLEDSGFDAGSDAGSDAGGLLDAGTLVDSGIVIEDSGVVDAGFDGGVVKMDSGVLMDAGVMDAGSMDAGSMDSGVKFDGGMLDAGPGDSGIKQDAGVPRFAGDPGVGKIYIGGSPDNSYPGTDTQRLNHWESKMGNRKLGVTRVFSPDATPPWADVDAAFARGMLPHMSFKSTEFAAIVAGQRDAWLDTIVAGFKQRAPKPIWWTFFHEPEDNMNTVPLATNYRAAVRYIYKYFATHGVVNATHVATAYMNYTFTAASGRDWRWWHPDYKGTTFGTKDNPDLRDFYTGVDSAVDLVGLDDYMQVFQFGDPISDYDVNYFDKTIVTLENLMGMLNHKGWVIPEIGFRVKQTGSYTNNTGVKSTSTGWVCGTLYEAETRTMMRNIYASAIARKVYAIEYWNNALEPTGYKDNRLDFCDPNGVRYDEMKTWLDDPRTARLP